MVWLPLGRMVPEADVQPVTGTSPDQTPRGITPVTRIRTPARSRGPGVNSQAGPLCFRHTFPVQRITPEDTDNILKIQTWTSTLTLASRTLPSEGSAAPGHVTRMRADPEEVRSRECRMDGIPRLSPPGARQSWLTFAGCGSSSAGALPCESFLSSPLMRRSFSLGSPHSRRVLRNHRLTPQQPRPNPVRPEHAPAATDRTAATHAPNALQAAHVGMAVNSDHADASANSIGEACEGPLSRDTPF